LRVVDTGNEAVDWMMMQMDLQTRAEAVAMGQLLAYRGKIRHINDSEPFQDKPIWYRFVDDDDKKKSKRSKRSSKKDKEGPPKSPRSLISSRKSSRKRAFSGKSSLASPAIHAIHPVEDLNTVCVVDMACLYDQARARARATRNDC
jgi:hypothetical protein